MTTGNTLRFKAINRILKTCASINLIIVTLTGLGAMTLAQTAMRPDRGTGPLGSYLVSDIENINLTNGNLNLSIPLASLPPVAGGKLSWTVNAQYNSKLWDVVTTQWYNDVYGFFLTNTLQLADIGWSIGGAYRIEMHDVSEDYFTEGPTDSSDPEWDLRVYRWKMVFTAPDGAKHELRPLDYPSYPGTLDFRRGYYKDIPRSDSVNASMRYYSSDGSFLWAKIDPFPFGGGINSWTVYFPDGTKVAENNGVQTITDINGNSIYIYTTISGNVTTTHYNDGLSGREITYTYNPSTNAGQLRYPAVGGSLVTIDVNWGTTLVQGQTFLIDPNCFIEYLIDQSIPVIRSIVLPPTEPGAPRRQFTFSYNSDITDNISWMRRINCSSQDASTPTPSHGWGSLSQMVTPTGATVNYSYQLDGVHERFLDPQRVPRETVTQKSVTHDGVTDFWTYSVNESSGSVTAPDGSFTTETHYDSDPGYAGYLGGGLGKGGLVYRTNRSDKVIVERHWIKLAFSGLNESVPVGVPVTNPVADAEYTTLKEGGTLVKMSARTFQYDYNGNVIQETDYDWFDPSLVSRDAQGVPTGVPASATVLRVINNSYYNQATTSNSANVYAKRTLPNGAPQILIALQQTNIGASITQYSYDNQAYGTPPSIGNLTNVSKWDDQAGAWRNTAYEYDSYGNRINVTDPNNNVTSIAYDSATHSRPTQVTVDPRNGAGTQTVTTVYDYWTGLAISVTDPNNQTTDTDYTNQLLGTTDPFMRPGVVTGPPVTSYVNGVTYANQRHKTRMTYYDNLRQVAVESDLNTSGDYKLKSRTTYDEMGREVLAESDEDGTGSYTISRQRIYAQMGKITMASNPRRSAAAATDGWTRTTSDELGRAVDIATFSGATRPPDTGTNSAWTGSVTTSYNANQTTLTDQAGKRRHSETDALGRLTKVTEDPSGLNHETTYLYDVLGNLRKVTQGAQDRWFAYDSLSRLIRVKNPEQNANNSLPPYADPVTGNSGWSMAFSYDAGGNLTQRTDARGVETDYSYDGLNRNTKIDYKINGLVTRSVESFYDGAVNGKGRFHYGWTQEGGVNATQTKIDNYDALGRPLNKQQSFWRGSDWGTPFVVQEGYNLVGAVETLTYPSGHVANYTHDQAGLLSSFSGNLGSGIKQDYATGMQYNAAGAMKREQFGTTIPLYLRRHYNNRGQLFDIRLGTDPNLSYDSDDLNTWQNAAGSWNRGALKLYYSTLDGCHVYGSGGTNNNGNLLRMDHHVPLDDAASNSVASIDRYDYDALNRVQSVTELSYTHGTSGNDVYQGIFRQAFLYDPWGNRTIDQVNTVGNVNHKAYAVDTATNRLTSVDGVAMGYDAAGNQTNDGSGLRVYDGENRMVEAKTTAGVTVGRYVYDANGNRVVRIVGSQVTWQIYGIGGELLAEYAFDAEPSAAQKEYGYRGGQLLVVWDGSETGDRQLQWLVQDHLGSTRMAVDRSGSLAGIRRHDFAPFGEELFAGIRSEGIGYSVDSVRQKFGSKERDNETGLDYFGARYFASLQGRFTSIDPVIFTSLRSVDPQSLNLYSYVRNNPLKLIDPNGMDWYEHERTGVIQWFNGNGEQKGYKRLNIGPNGYQITNVRATGQFKHLNSHNITLYNDSRFYRDNGVYRPLVGPPPDPNAGLRLAADMIAHEAVHAVSHAAGLAGFVFGMALIQQGDVSHSRREDPYVVRLQAQGGGVEESVVLTGQNPITVAQGLAGLEDLKTRLSRKELQERADPFRRAERFIRNAAGNGIGPPGKSFNLPPPKSDIRVDVEILKGVNFRN